MTILCLTKIKIESYTEELYEAYPLEDGNVSASHAKFEISHPDLQDTFILTVNSSICIDQGLCISKLKSLTGLQNYMIETILKNHEFISEEPEFEIECDEDYAIGKSLFNFIKEKQKIIDANLRDCVRQQVSDELSK